MCQHGCCIAIIDDKHHCPYKSVDHEVKVTIETMVGDQQQYVHERVELTQARDVRTVNKLKRKLDTSLDDTKAICSTLTSFSAETKSRLVTMKDNTVFVTVAIN